MIFLLTLLLTFSVSDGIPKKKKRVVKRKTTISRPKPVLKPTPLPPLLTTTGNLSNGTPAPRELMPLFEVPPCPVTPLRVTTVDVIVIEENKGSNKLWYLLGGAGIGTTVVLLLDRDDLNPPPPIHTPTPLIEPTPATPIPEPSSVVLMLLAGLGLFGIGKRVRRK